MENNKPNPSPKDEKTSDQKALAKKSASKKPVKKESVFSKIFTADDARNVKSYLIYDILIPKIRETVDKMITEGSHMIFLGSPDAKSADTSRSYTKYYRSESGRNSYDRSAYDIRTPKFYTEIEANDVLDQLEDMLDRYGLVRVGDLYDLMGWKQNHTDNNYGWRDMRTARIVRERDQYILTGRNPIREALKNHHDLEKLLVQKGELSGSAKEIVQKAKEQKVQIQVVEKSRLDDIAPHHQGLIAFASAYQYATVEEILETAQERGEDPFIVLLDGVTDPHNLGAIIRTAECAGVHGIIVPQHHSVGLSPAAVKASAGAVEYVKVARVTNLVRTVEMLQKQNIWVYAVSMDGKDYRKIDFKGGVALVIGSEEDGISRLVGETCDDHVSLPKAGRIESLNASVAAGIMMYQVFSGRQ